MDKPTVNYTPSSSDFIREGYGAFVRPTNHPDRLRVSNTKPVQTSKVIQVFPDGGFETQNTIYLPELKAVELLS